MQYIRLSDGLKSYKLIPESDNIWDHIKSNDRDSYVSIFKYNEEQYKAWQRTKTIAGIKDVFTSRLVFDFDDAVDTENARQDAVSLVTRLLSKGIPTEAVQVSFSGNKGYGVEVETDERLTNDEFKNITRALAADLKTFDPVVSDASRIVRVIGTKHQKSGLYKFPLTIDQLSSSNTDAIKALATNLDNVDEKVMHGWATTVLPDALKTLKLPPQKEKTVEVEPSTLDLRARPKWLSDAKYALQEGYFLPGERNTAFMILGSTYKNQGFNKEITYRMLKGVAEVQSARNGQARYADEELWNNIVEVVFSDHWKGGQYSYDNTPLLQEVSARLGLRRPDEETKPVIFSDLGGESFKRYANSFYETRIFTGLDDLDEAFPICAGSNVAIVGAASSGKTALSLNILKKMKENGGVSVFASLDMSKSRLYEKLLYSVTNGKKSRDQIYQDYIEGNGEKYDRLVKDAFPNTYIFGKSAPTVDEMRSYLIKVQEYTGKPVRLLLIDYFERLSSEKSEDTAASKDVASGIQDLIADFPELTPITLYQPNKFALGGGPDKPILNYASIKGSSFIIQSARQILSLWRPFFTPEFKENDKFMEMAILKNDLGELGKFCYKWEGKTGNISYMSDEDNMDYNAWIIEKTKKESAFHG